MIPDEAVEAALLAYKHATFHLSTRNALIAALEAAAPHMLAEAWNAGRVAGNHSLVQPNPYEVSK